MTVTVPWPCRETVRAILVEANRPGRRLGLRCRSGDVVYPAWDVVPPPGSTAAEMQAWCERQRVPGVGELRYHRRYSPRSPVCRHPLIQRNGSLAWCTVCGARIARER